MKIKTLFNSEVRFRFISFLFVLSSVIPVLFYPMQASALSAAQKQVFDSGIGYFNTDDSSSSCSANPSTVTVPAGTLPTFIPEPYNGAFTQGANNNNVAPALVAALFSEEHAFGGDTHNPSTANLPSAWANFIKNHPDPNSNWKTSGSGAEGPFQFLPSTWTGLGYSLNDINNLVTASDAAAKYVASNGATKDKPESTWQKAIFSYNHADWYVNAVLTYYDYYNGQPGASAGGGSSTITVPGSSCSTVCSATNASNGSNTIVLDPGHAGAPTEQIDPDTGLETVENGGAPGEMQNMWDTAQIIKTKLEAAGYNVVLTKNSENDTAGFVTKVGRADAANPALVVSLHYTGGVKFGVANDHFGVTPQQVGRFRENKDNGKKATFSNAALAQQSQQFAQTIAQERDKVGDNANVAPLDLSFPKDRPDVLAWGDIPMVQLLSKVPWVYNETGAVGFDVQKYAEGITNGIIKAVPLSGSPASTDSPSNCSGGVVQGNITQTAIGLAWPTAFSSPTATRQDALTPTAAYAAALQASNPTEYNASADGLGSADCGVFVATVMHASGADKDYPPISTIKQAQYVIDNPNKYQAIYPATTTDQLQAGDILILNEGTTVNPDGTINVGQGGANGGGHTFIYLGGQSTNNEASASLNTRSANLGSAQLTDNRGQYLIARLK